MNVPPLTISFSLEDQTVDALELTLDHLKRTAERPMSWKWVVIGLHTALHGSFGLALRRTDGAQLLIPEQERQTYARWERERATGAPEAPGFTQKRKGENVPVAPVVDWFLELHEKVQNPNRMNYLGGKPLTPTASQTENIKRLNNYRGVLTHFSDTTFQTTVDDILPLISDGLDIAHFLLTKARPIDTIKWPELAERARQLVAEAMSEIANMGATDADACASS